MSPVYTKQINKLTNKHDEINVSIIYIGIALFCCFIEGSCCLRKVLTDSSPVGDTHAVIWSAASLADVVLRVPANVSGLNARK